MSTTAINVDHIARVEGHGNIHLLIEDGQVKDVQMQVVEPARLFESMVRGRDWKEVSYVASRICGICSASHVVTDLKAIESIFRVRPSRRTQLIRDLLVYGSFLQNHGAHLFVFAAPDYLGEASIFPLREEDPELFEQALALKGLGNRLCTAIGGRSIHPITAVVGGFTHEVSAGEYRALADEMEASIPFAKRTVDLFRSFPICDLTTDGDMLALIEEGSYPIQSAGLLGFVGSGDLFACDQVFDWIEEYEVPHSGALFARRIPDGGSYLTCALSRINASWDNLGREAKLAAAKAGLRPPERNPFMNNVAQAVELVDALEKCAAICRELAEGEGSSEPVPFEVRGGIGVGVTEAPRGVLIHRLELDDAGKVRSASIVTPTAQNVANLEADVRKLACQLIEAGAEADAIRLEVEKLVRAYDPCLSCSVH